MKDTITVIVLASGKGRRMGYATPKPLLKIHGISFIQHVLYKLESVKQISRIIVTEATDHRLSRAKLSSSKPLVFVTQPEPNGPAGALAEVVSNAELDKNILILLGDAPLIDINAVHKLISYHLQSGVDLSLLVGESDDNLPFGKITIQNNKYCFEQPNINSNGSSLYSLGPIMINTKSLTSSIHELLSTQESEKRIEPIVSIFNNLGHEIGLVEVAITSPLQWNINTRNELFKSRSL